MKPKSKVVTIPYDPFPKQAQFHSSNAKYRLFGGAAGPGKSTALLWEAIFQIICFERLNLPIDCIILRRTFPELEKSIIQPFRREVPRELYASYNDSKHVVTFRNGSTLNFGYSESDKDIEQYQGAEFHFIGFDELTHFTLGQWQFMGSRNRCKHAKSFPNMAGATNPGSRGHKWVKALWVDRKPAPGMADYEYNAADYDFIPATLDDNPIFAGDSQYRRELERKPKALRDAMLYGRWDAFAGQYFDNFHPDKHVRRVEHCELKPWNPRWVSIDWGYQHPSAVYWHAKRDDGLAVTYRELVQNKLTPTMLGAAIKERCVGYDGKQEKIDRVFLSPDAFAKRTNEHTVADMLREELGIQLPAPEPADNDRVGGWMLMYQLLEQGKWVITDNCKELIEGIPILTRDLEKHPEDCLKMEGDDPQDSARYGIKSYLSESGVPVEVRVQERLNAIPDMSMKMVLMERIRQQEQAKNPASVPIRRWRR